MKLFTRALLATIGTVALLFVYAWVIRHRLETYYLHCGCDIPLSFRMQAGMSAFIYHGWWLISIPTLAFWAAIFAIVRGMRRTNSTAAASS